MQEGLSEEIGRGCRIRTGEWIKEGGRWERTEVGSLQEVVIVEEGRAVTTEEWGETGAAGGAEPGTIEVGWTMEEAREVEVVVLEADGAALSGLVRKEIRGGGKGRMLEVDREAAE